MLNIQDLIENKVNKLWYEFSELEICKIPPLAKLEIPDEGLIFMGVNPSLSNAERERQTSKSDKTCEFYQLKNEENNEHRYFKKFFDVSRQTKLKWGHLDLLYCRGTNQKDVKAFLKTERGKDFLYQQCMITKLVLNEIIDENKPRIFVITNTFVRDLLGRYRKTDEPKIEEEWWVNYDFVWDDNLGTYTYKNTPFFFTSMLTGQRPLDNGSFERLIWHINLVKRSLLIK